MKHKMSMAYVRIYTQQSIFFHKVSSDHQSDNFKAFSRLSILLIANRTNTNSCQARILVNFTNVAPAHSSIQYRQICWYHLIEETHSYPHVWKFPENILKYLYGGTFETCKLFIDTHCIYTKDSVHLLIKKTTPLVKLITNAYGFALKFSCVY